MSEETTADRGLLVRLGQAEREPRQYLKYNYFTLDPLWRRLPPAERAAGKEELARTIEEASGHFFVLRSYNLLAMHRDADFMLWSVSATLEDQSDLLSRVYGTAMGAYLRLSYTFLSMTKHSQYVRDHRHEGQEGTSLEVRPSGARYLFVYPMVKARPWYRLPFEERNSIMREHIKIGHRYPTIKINTSYSFGLDDQEFVVAFETDHPDDFLDLVQELRGSQSSAFTATEYPTFTCINQGLREILDALDPVDQRVVAGHR